MQEFIKHKGCDLSREELITRVWEEFGFTPSGNNLNKAVSELRKSFQSLGEGHEFIVTVPRYGFRFEADVIFQPGENIPAADPQPSSAPQEVKPQHASGKKWVIVAVLIVAALVTSFYFSRPQGIIVPAKLKPLKEKIARCSLWIINDHGRPLVLSKLAERLEANSVACEREEYDIYYFSARFSISDADEVFIGACPASKTSLCKTIRYKSGAQK
ncbi:winged helix-turn-helix domain-containing protein [Enterobacter asburiae]